METTYSEPQRLWEILPESLSQVEESIIHMKAEGYTLCEIAVATGQKESRVRDLYEAAKLKIYYANDQRRLPQV